ncbi:MAG: TonB-dependent receptor, partial [Steroidobacteraceae bacterium]|nr:TonB-dependent receptor [Steroidobacteraceae bacterium]
SDREFQANGEDNRVSKSIDLRADYELSERDRFSASGEFYRRDAGSHLEENTLLLDTDGDAIQRSQRVRRGDEVDRESGMVLDWRHSGEKDGDGLTVTVQRAESAERRPLRFTENFFLPARPPTVQDQGFFEEQVRTELAIENEKRFDSGGKFLAGYELVDDDAAFKIAQTTSAEPGQPSAIDPDFSNLFRYTQTNHAVYASYELPLAPWTMLAGLRLERVDLEARQVTTAQRNRQDYVSAYPSLHFAREIGEQQSLTFSYSRRVSRPAWQDMNPFRVRMDPYALQEGNPDLQPTEVDALEAGWSREAGQRSLSATLYARRSRDEVTYVTTPISPTVVVTRPENLGESMSGGLELAASNRLMTNVDFRLSGNVYYNEIDASNLGFDDERSTIGYSAKAALTARIGERHRAQLNLNTSGKRLTPQGYRRGSTVLDMGYRYQLRSNFSLTASVSDVFETRRDRIVMDTPEISNSIRIQQAGRIVFIGVSWSLANDANKQSESFEYE